MSIVKQQTALEAERIVLGTLMAGKWDSCQDTVASLTLPETWTGAGHAVIFDAVRRCYGATPQDTVPISLQSMTELLSSAGTLKMAGGVEYLEALLESAMNFDDAQEAFFQVQEAAVRRYLATMGRYLQKAAADPRRGTMDVILEHHRRLREAGSKILAPPIREPPYKLFDSINMLEKLHNGGYLVRTGYHGLDDELLGFLPGDLCVLAAYPQVDLTAFVTGMLSQSVLPCKTSVPALVVTLRARLKELVASLLMQLSSVAMNRVGEGLATVREWSEIAEAAAKVYKPLTWGRFIVNRTETQSVEELRMLACAAQRANNCKLLVIDGPEVFMSKHEPKPIATVRELKKLAEDFGISVVVLAGLKKPALDKPAAPVLADLEELGPLADVADTLALMWHAPRLDDEGDGTGEEDLNVFVARHWHRPGCTIQMPYMREFRAYEFPAAGKEQERLS